jgi:hypothetical protein
MNSSFSHKSLPIGNRLLRAVSLLTALLGIFLISLPAFSQGNQGTIQGGIFDQTGGAIAGAMVTVTDVARGVSRSLTTDDAGQYVAASLNPGTYTVRAEAKGFRSVEHSGVLVQVGQNIRVDLTVQPGEQTQTVTVTGELPEINTTDATLGGTVSNQAILSLPLNGRNFERLLQLRPGVVTPVGAGTGDQSTNGMRTGADLTMIEGLSQMSPSTGASVLNASYRTGDASSLLPIDAIQEFNTEQNPKAEYGWEPGSVINVGVKSGTNSLHGAAYAFGRDARATDAANFFSDPAFPGATPATLEQFGATAGGRIIKDKLFWFAGYEGLRTTLGDVALVPIPTDISTGDAKTSMVDACNALKGAGKTISPLSAQLAGLNTATCTVSPSSSTFENLFPFNPTSSTSFAPGLITTGPLNNGFIKSDYIINQHNHVSGMYYISKASQIVSYSVGQLEPQWRGAVPTDAQMFNGAWTWTPTSAWVNDVRGGYAYVHNQTVSGDVNMIPSNPYPQGYGFNTGVTNPLYGGLPEIDISSISPSYLGAGKRTGVRGPEGTVDLVDNVSRLFGKHAFKFGFEYMDSIYDNNSYNRANGEIKFKDLAHFLTGSPQKGQILIGNPDLIARQHAFAGFFQDDWRVTTKVTLNLGLRYEYDAPPTERFNYIGNFDPNVTGNTPAVLQVGPGAPLKNLYNPDHKDFSPRVGVAWDVRGNGKTVIRAGGSLLNAMLITSELLNPVPFGANFPDLGINTSGTAANAHSPALFPLTGGQLTWSIAGPVFPGNATSTVGGVTYTGLTCTAPATAGGPGPCPTTGVDPKFREPYVASWNLDIQRAITNSLTVDVAYVGNHGFKQGSEADINQPAIGAGYNTPFTAAEAAAAEQAAGVTAGTYAGAIGLSSNQFCLASGNCGITNTAAEVGPYASKFPYLSQIITTGNLFFSNYNALELTVSERAAHGLSFLAGYTYSHALDNQSSSSISQSAFPLDSRNPRLGYGSTDNDIRHRFTFSPTYDIPGMKAPGQMLRGWTLSGILTLQRGLPWYPIDTSNDFTGTGEVNAGGVQTWNYTGPTSAFVSGPTGIPCFGPLSGCTPAIPQACVTAAQAPYTGNAQLMASASAALAAAGCYMRGSGILTPPAYGTIGNASRNLFPSPAYYNVDFSVSKLWKLKERFSAQFRVEVFNLFNRADFSIPGSGGTQAAGGTDPSAAQFGCACVTPDNANPVLGSGGPRHIQFGLKLTY